MECSSWPWLLSSSRARSLPTWARPVGRCEGRASALGGADAGGSDGGGGDGEKAGRRTWRRRGWLEIGMGCGKEMN